MSEIELKFVLDEAGAAALKTRLKELGLTQGPLRPRALRSVYHDTPDHALARAGMAVRLRKDGRRWLQTVKARASLAGGLSRVEEIESPAPGGRLDLAAFPDATRAGIAAAIGERPLAPVFETEMKRASLDLPLPGGGSAELALDEGTIRAAAHEAAFREAELELRDGELAALYELAAQLFPEGGLHLSTRSKAARGYLLATKGRIDDPPVPRKARAVPLAPEQSAETAARDVLRESVAQVAANIRAVLESDEPEGPHQLRVGLRRLRSALTVFAEVTRGPEAARLNAEARWLGQETGHLRDLDVLIHEIVEPDAAAHPDEPGFGVLHGALDARRADLRDALRTTLRQARAQRLQLDLARFVEARGWLAPQDYDQTARLAQPVADLAVRALDARWKAVTKRARGIADLPVPARHELRKRLKKLRYATEFLSDLYPQKRVRPFVKQLRALQQVFGDLNDAAMAEAQLAAGPARPAAADPDAQRAVGLLIGTRRARADDTWPGAQALWHDLKKTGPFWR